MRRVDCAPKVVLQHLVVMIVMYVVMMIVVIGVAKMNENKKDEDESLFQVE